MYCVLCSWFVEINTWQVLKCIYLVLIQHSWLVKIYAWHGYFGWACISAVNSSFRRNPCLITKLFSLKYKVSFLWCMWVAHEFHAIFIIMNMTAHIYRQSYKTSTHQIKNDLGLKNTALKCCDRMSSEML